MPNGHFFEKHPEGRWQETLVDSDELMGGAGSEWAIFEQSSHVAHLEEEDEYRRVVEDFMRRVEEGQG